MSRRRTLPPAPHRDLHLVQNDKREGLRMKGKGGLRMIGKGRFRMAGK
jgi:hypothetical protein